MSISSRQNVSILPCAVSIQIYKFKKQIKTKSDSVYLVSISLPNIIIRRVDRQREETLKRICLCVGACVWRGRDR